LMILHTKLKKREREMEGKVSKLVLKGIHKTPRDPKRGTG